MAEGFTLMDGAKVALTEYYANNGSFPSSNTEAGLADDTDINGKYVKSVKVGNADGTITATFGNGANSALTASGKDTVVLTGIAPGSDTGTTSSKSENIVWTCSGGIDTKYLPSSCRTATGN